ncbi:Xylulose kinase [Trachymyrmex cornetzi]|uniref:Xylulose kinase n=1 Tax=Trachymyrmex cornetzi TaxID=471704 RepID=A0A195E6G3_9HYME|nr:Xylulose kinase [Trachymyrmex cornetzi]
MRRGALARSAFAEIPSGQKLHRIRIFAGGSSKAASRRAPPIRKSVCGPQTDDKEDDGRISRDRQHASGRLDSPIVKRRLVAVPAGSRTICIAEYEAPVLSLPDVYESRFDSGDIFGMIPDSKPSLLYDARIKRADKTRRGKASGLGGVRRATLVSPPCQHGTVYWSKGSRNRLQCLDPIKFLHEQFATSFSVTHSPIWMDSSTSKECSVLEEIVGGPHKLAETTGSRAYERFSGPQIAKIARTKPEAYCSTERISLVSNFIASLFLGDYAPIDWSDGSGMNLLNIRTKDWDDMLLETCATGLREKLGNPVSSYSDIGPISPYFVERFSFNEKCRIIAFTGDNPGSLIGMRLKEGDIACSLGTSDTLLLWLNKPKTITDGHVLCNPVDNEAYMALLCFKNGSLTRERIRDDAAQGSWQIFNELLESTPRGNFGNFALYYDIQEILPFVIGDYRYNKANDEISRYSSKEVEVRALIEGQTEAANSAMMGAAYQAKHGLMQNNCSFDEITHCLPELTLVCQPYDDAESIYKPMTVRYRKIIDQILKKRSEQKHV